MSAARVEGAALRGASPQVPSKEDPAAGVVATAAARTKRELDGFCLRAPRRERPGAGAEAATAVVIGTKDQDSGETEEKRISTFITHH